MDTLQSVACPRLPYSRADLGRLEARDAAFVPKSFSTNEVRSLDGSACSPITLDGVARGQGGRCVDLGVPAQSATLDAMGALQPLEYLPEPGAAVASASSPSADLARKLQHVLSTQQFGGAIAGCGLAGAPPWRAAYFVNTVPLIGFGSIIEYGILYLTRATNLRSQLVFGRHSSPGWTSSWFCGAERSLSCYFNVSSCCGALVHANGRPVELDRRRNPISIGLPGFNSYGSLWVSAQLAHFFFERLTPRARQAVDKRRAEVRLPRPGASSPSTPRQTCIGVHIRGGDACHASRFCPRNLTGTFFATASRLRDKYGIGRMVLATDSEAAAALCAQGALGFDCRTIRMARAKFDSPTFIEQRVSQHAQGSGATEERGRPHSARPTPPPSAPAPPCSVHH